MTRAIARACRSRQRIAVLLLDLDHFKDVNDTYGHAVGDKVLMAVAERLTSDLRRVDALSRVQGGEFEPPSRLAGDEFAVVLTEIEDLDSVAGVAQRLCATVSEPVATE